MRGVGTVNAGVDGEHGMLCDIRIGEVKLKSILQYC